MLCFDEPRDPTEWEKRMAKFGTYIASIGISRDRSNRAIKQTEDRYITLFQSIDAGFSIMEVIEDNDLGNPVDLRVLEVNQMLETVTGLTSVVGKTLRELLPKSAERLFQTLARVASSGESAREEIKVSGRWFQIYSYRVDKPADRRVALLFEEITDRKRLEKNLKNPLVDVRTGNPGRALALWALCLQVRGPRLAARRDRAGGTARAADLDPLGTGASRGGAA